MKKKWVSLLIELSILSIAIVLNYGYIQKFLFPPPPQTPEPEPPLEELEGKIFFLSDREGSWAIYSMNPDGTNQTKFFDFSLASISDFDISPDSTQLIYPIHIDYIEYPTGVKGWKVTLYLVNISVTHMNVTGLPIKLIDEFDLRVPVFSPSGEKIFFIAGYWNGLYRVNKDGSDETLLLEGVLNPACSPDGTQIAFDSGSSKYVRGLHASVILLANFDGSNISNIVQLTDGMNDQNPSWRLDGLQLGFQSPVKYGGNSTVPFEGDYASEIFVVNTDGTGRRQITYEDPMNPYNFSYQGFRDGEFVYIGHRNPVWLPSGQFLCELHNNGNIQILVMNADGTNIKQLTSEGRNRYPVWVPTNP